MISKEWHKWIVFSLWILCGLCGKNWIAYLLCGCGSYVDCIWRLAFFIKVYCFQRQAYFICGLYWRKIRSACHMCRIVKSPGYRSWVWMLLITKDEENNEWELSSTTNRHQDLDYFTTHWPRIMRSDAQQLQTEENDKTKKNKLLWKEWQNSLYFAEGTTKTKEERLLPISTSIFLYKKLR